MNTIKGIIKQSLDIGLRVTSSILFILYITMVLFTLVMFFTRYLFGYSFHWIGPYCRFSLVWISLLGSASALRKSRHFGITFFIDSLPSKLRIIIVKLVIILICFFSIYMIIYGIQLVNLGFSQVEPSLHIRIGYIYLVFPVAAIFYLIIGIEFLLSKDKDMSIIL